MKRKLAIEIISFLFILLFVYAGANKLVDYDRFVIQIGQSPIFMGLGPYISFFVILAEVVISIMLMIAKTRLLAMYASLTLMVMFTTYIIAILNFSSFIPCSCGGILEALSWRDHLIVNACFVVLAAIGVLLLHLEEERIISSATLL